MFSSYSHLRLFACDHVFANEMWPLVHPLSSTKKPEWFISFLPYSIVMLVMYYLVQCTENNIEHKTSKICLNYSVSNYYSSLLKKFDFSKIDI